MKEYFTLKEVAALLGRAEKTVRNWRSQGRRCPPFEKFLARLRISKDAFNAWCKEQMLG